MLVLLVVLLLGLRGCRGFSGKFSDPRIYGLRKCLGIKDHHEKCMVDVAISEATYILHLRLAYVS